MMAQRTVPSREWQAQMAWEAHQAMVLMERRVPSLKDNPAWKVIFAESYAQYEQALARPWTK